MGAIWGLPGYVGGILGFYDMGVRGYVGLLHRLHSKQADVSGEGAEVSRGILRSFWVRFRV